jgi:hypothetical protein
MMVAAAACCVSAAAIAKTTFLFPVAPGDPGGAPWKVEAWSDDGCAHCGINAADHSAVQDLVADLLAQDQQNTPERKLPIYVVRGGMADGETSLAKLKKVLEGCKIGSAGMLSPNETTSIVAFGVRIDCEKTQQMSFMSVVMGKEHVPVAIYWLPDRPIVALDTH